MNDKPKRSDTNLTETMAAKIDIEPVSDPAGEKRIADLVSALEGVTDFRIENGVVHVSYDPLTSSEKKIAHAVSAAGGKVKAADSETEAPHPDLPQQPR
jgi:hypothetical protein